MCIKQTKFFDPEADLIVNRYRSKNTFLEPQFISYMGLLSCMLWAVVGLSLLGWAVVGASFPWDNNPIGARRQNPTILDAIVQTLNGAKKHLLSAAVARSISIFGMYPVDTIKTRIQIEQANPFRPTGLYGTNITTSNEDGFALKLSTN